MKDYIVCIEFNIDKNNYSIDYITESELSSIINAYKIASKNFSISGIQYKLSKPKRFKIYKITNHQQFKRLEFTTKAIIAIVGGSKTFTINLLEKNISCVDVTANYIGNLQFGELKLKIENKTDFISKKRIEELSGINKDKFDLIKVLQFCKELNDAWKLENYVSVGVLIRAFKDHIPPVFECRNFSEVANNYGDAGQSFSKSMKILESSSKNISDRLIHSHIRKSETLPNEKQVNFSQDLDVLLEEIVRILK